MLRFLATSVSLALGMSIASIAGAEIPDLEWFDAEVVDVPVSAVSTPSGTSVLHLDDTWHVVYEKDGEVYHRARTPSGWLEAEPISNDPGVSRAPHLGEPGSPRAPRRLGRRPHRTYRGVDPALDERAMVTRSVPELRRDRLHPAGHLR